MFPFYDDVLVLDEHQGLPLSSSLDPLLLTGRCYHHSCDLALLLVVVIVIAVSSMMFLCIDNVEVVLRVLELAIGSIN